MALMDGEHVGPFNLGNPGEFTMLELAEVYLLADSFTFSSYLVWFRYIVFHHMVIVLIDIPFECV